MLLRVTPYLTFPTPCVRFCSWLVFHSGCISCCIIKACVSPQAVVALITLLFPLQLSNYFRKLADTLLSHCIPLKQDHFIVSENNVLTFEMLEFQMTIGKKTFRTFTSIVEPLPNSLDHKVAKIQ